MNLSGVYTLLSRLSHKKSCLGLAFDILITKILIKIFYRSSYSSERF